MTDTIDARWGQGSVGIPVLHGAADPEALQLHLAAIEYTLATPITIKDKDDIRSAPHWSEHFTPFEHQVRNLITYCRRAPVALIADDVGLGKTITAGLIISELMTRKKIRRILVVAPKLLLPQWCEELVEKFHIEADAASGSAILYLLKSQVPVVVTTYDTARDYMEEIKKSFFEMLILDEAHKLRNLFGSAKQPKLATVIHTSLQNRDFKYVVMLTATPIQNRLWDLYSLIDCLATARGHRNPLGTKEYFSAYYLNDSAATARELKPGRREEFRRHLGDYMVRTSRRDSNLIFPERHVRTIGCPAGPAEASLARLVSDTLPSLNALSRTSLAQALMSSPPALLSELQSMAANGTIAPDIPERAAVLVQEAGPGCKLERLRGIIRELVRADPLKWRVVVFTRRKATQALIGRAMEAEGVRVGFIEGGKAVANTRSIRDLWADPPRINLLVSTDAGAEGVNLQAANTVINYDLPWNPMIVEQRIGRVQRLASPHRYVNVVNLVVAGSVEEQVVARLLAKLQAISEAYGDVEAILESSSLDEDRMEETIRDLVLRALMGQDVELATARIQESIEKAKAVYDKEKVEVEKNLGALDAMHSAGPKLPDLDPVRPRLTVKELVLGALPRSGVSLEATGDGRWLARPEGRNPYIITFDENDPDIVDDGLSTFGRRRAVLYAEGQPAFERLVGEWSKRDSAWILDGREAGADAAREAAFLWASNLGPDVTPVAWKPRRAAVRFAGKLHTLGSASVAHDKYEKLLSIEIADPHVPADESTIPKTTIPLKGELGMGEYAVGLDEVLRSGVGQDSSISGFDRFYELRGQEEIARAQGDVRRVDAVRMSFKPSFAAGLVAAEGTIYENISGDLEFKLPGDDVYSASLTIAPSVRKIISEPERVVCDVTHRMLPEQCVARCEISGKRVLRPLLLMSERSRRLALPEHVRRCEATGRQLLMDEVARSDMSGKTVDSTLLVASAISGRRGLAEEMSTCEFTGSTVTTDEALRSEVSGRWLRSDEVARSVESGVRGHRSEFERCAVTEDWLLPAEVSASGLSGRKGKKSLMITCELSGRLLLPDEAAPCEATGKLVGKDRLATSDLSGRTVQEPLLVRCPESGRRGLESEMGTCSVTGALVDPSHLVSCSVTAAPVLKRLTVTCPVTGRQLLREKAVSAHSGRLGHPDGARKCTWTGWTLLGDEAVRCAWTHVTLSKDQCLPNSISRVHAGMLRELTSAPAADASEVARFESAFAAAKLRPKRLWLSRSPTSRVQAMVVECTAALGLRKKYFVAFVNETGTGFLGTVGEVEPKVASGG
jgi:superfamily II DNA or RNA helicase